jgi:hypothetical protein
MWDDADETQGLCPSVTITVGFVGGNVESYSRLHNDLPSRTMGNTFTLHHKDLVLKRMLVDVKNGSWLKLDHTHRKIRRPFGLSDDPANGLVLTDGFRGHFSIIYT